VGRRQKTRLNAVGVHNILRLKRADRKRIRDEFGVVLESTVQELNGEVMMDMEERLPKAKQVMSSRSFGTRVTELEELKQAIAYHAGIACARMRSKPNVACAHDGAHINADAIKCLRQMDCWRGQ